LRKPGETRRDRTPRAVLGAALIAVLALLAAASFRPAAALAAESAVVFLYHRFGEHGSPSTNIRLDQFDAQIAELKSGKYTVLPLPEIIAALRDHRPLPDDTVGLSIDDAYESAYTQAWPRLKAAGLPFTLFVATDSIEQKKAAGLMSWEQIRALAKAGVTIGAHTASHLHMPDHDAARNRADIERSNARFRAELGQVPRLFAYPYGEMSRAVGALVSDAGYDAAFGQHSGAIGAGSDMFYLPRFELNERYGKIDRFRLAARALPLPVRDVTPADPLLAPGRNPPVFGFTVVGDLARHAGRIACYSSVAGRARVERLGARRIEVRIARPFPPGHGRVNCTMPGPDGRWRWLGMQFYVPKKPR
jgi:peptidoglycan/xylan/chitin deacetylase (PgdA/CDA1 family)